MRLSRCFNSLLEHGPCDAKKHALQPGLQGMVQEIEVVSDLYLALSGVCHTRWPD